MLAWARSHQGLGYAICLLILCVLWAQATELVFARQLAGVAALLIYVLAIPHYGIREYYLLGVSLILTTLAFWLLDDPLTVLFDGMVQGTFLMAFILLLAMLQETALKSPAIAECGHYLTGQLPGRRFTALFWGTNMISLMFNLGIVSLLSPLVQKGLETDRGDGAMRTIRERRQVTAILRGFAWSIIWIPTALAPLTVLELIDGADRHRWTLLGLVFTCCVFLWAWLDDRLRFPPDTSRMRVRSVPAFPATSALHFLMAVSGLFLLIFIGVTIIGLSFVFSLMLACPITMAGWLFIQQAKSPRLAATWMDMRSIVLDRLPRLSSVAVTLAFSGLIGTIAASLIPADDLGHLLALDDQPDWLVLSLLPMIMLALSWLAVSPIMLAVFFGNLFANMSALPTDPTLLALSISCGWGMTMIASPFATVVLMLSQQHRLSGLTLSIGWNLRYAIGCQIMLTVFFWLLTQGL